MNLNEIDIKLAERTNPQAINLGFVTARRYFLPLFSASVLASLPLLIVACLISYFYEAFTLASLLLWWGKPYVDRVILINASKLLFREKIGFNAIFDSLKQALKNGLWLNLTFFRFSTARSLTLPVMVLEELSGKAYSQRTKVISRGSGSATAITIGLLHFDWFLYLNVIFAIFMLLPDSVATPFNQSLMDYFFYGTAEQFHWLLWVLLPAQALCSAVIEIFYVMIGFMMYLNSRIRTEGWHIELAFKQIAERLSGTGRAIMSFLGVIGLAVLLSQFPGQTAHANTDSNLNVNINPEQDKQIFKDFLMDEDTNPYHEKGQWVKNKTEQKQQSKNNNASFDGGVDFSGFAAFLKILLIVAGLIFVYWAIANRERFSGLFQGRVQVEDDLRPSVMFGLDIRKESLPDDIAGEAQKLLNADDIQGALSLLYRGSLASLVHDYDVEIRESDTEGDCLRHTEKRAKHSTFEYFKNLTQTWQSTVYAHRAPEHSRVETLITGFNPAFPLHYPAQEVQS